MAADGDDSGPAAQDDAALLHAIAAQRDHGAFAELCARYESRAFSLALRITRSTEQAEEVVQDAMLAVWHAAHTCRAEDNCVRGWIMTIVAHQGMKALRVRGRARKKEEARGAMDIRALEEFAAQADVAAHADHEELLAALRSQLDSLPRLQRELLVLYYGGELSQRQMSRALAIPQQTISHRINEALAELRSALTKAGFAAALPLVREEGLSEAICGGHATPPGLSEKIAAQALRAPTTVGSSLSWPLGVACGVVAAAAVSALIWMGRSPNPATPMPAPVAAPAATAAPSLTDVEKASPAIAPAPAVKPFARTWNFDRPGEESEFPVRAGNWSHGGGGGSGGSGCMEIPTMQFTAKLPVPVARLPLRVTYRVQYIGDAPEDGFQQSVIWTRCAGTGAMVQTQSIIIMPNAWIEATVYVSADGVQRWLNGRLRHYWMVKPTATAELLFSSYGAQRIDDLRVCEIRPDEIPDVSQYAAAVDRIPPAQRIGWVPLPDLTPRGAKVPTSVHFMGPKDGDVEKAP